MRKLEDSIWFLDNENQWILFRSGLPSFEKQLKELQGLSMGEDSKKKEVEEDKLFFLNKHKTETKGQVVFTPKGYGTLQKVDLANSTITVKGKGWVQEFTKKEVLYEIPLNLLMVESGMFRLERLLVSVNSQAKDIVDKIEDCLGSRSVFGCKIFYKGKSFEKGPETCEALGMTPSSKLMVSFSMGSIKSVKRFSTESNGWGYSPTSIDAICFMASRAVRVVGFGVYLSQQNELALTARINRGDSHSAEEYIYTKDFVIKPTDTQYHPKIYQCLFNRPLDVPMGENVSCIIRINAHTSYYGNNGVVSLNGEDGTVFTFSQCKCSTNGTSTSSGQIPEIYYI